MDVPSEILDEIFAFLSTKSLISCATVSKAFHASATRALYRDICLPYAWQVPYIKQATLTPIMHRTPTLIRRRDFFLRTIKENKALQAHIRSASFLTLTSVSQSPMAGVIEQIFQEWERSNGQTATPFIHLSCRLDEFWPFLVGYARIRSLRLSVLPHYERHEAQHYQIFRRVAELDGLEHLTIDHMLWLKQDEVDQGRADVALRCEEPFSGVKTLAFVNSTLPDKNLEKLLKWPRALRAFLFEVDRSHSKTLFENPRTFEPPCDIPQLIFRALRTHAETLEYISFIGAHWHDLLSQGAAPPVPDLLKTFTNLKRLGLPLNFLAKVSVDGRPYHITTTMSLELHAFLPPSLEELKLEWPTAVVSRAMYDEAWPFNFRKAPVNQSFLRWLLGLAREKVKVCPRLTKVAVYWQSESLDKRVHLPSVDQVVVDELRREYRQAGIDLFIGSSKHGPLFGLGSERA